MITAAAEDTIAGRIAAVRSRIAAACKRSGRDPGDVTLIAVSKTWPAEDVATAFAAGVTDFGENRVQEALAKIGDTAAVIGAGPTPAWHLIGHLQTNKARAATGPFAILHAVDSDRLLEAIARATRDRVRIMIEVNVAGEAKFGVAPTELGGLLTRAAHRSNIAVEGLMTVAPRVAEPESNRPIFRSLRTLAEEHGLKGLSMGMTDDFEVAIEEGATHIRVGRAVFGERS